LQSISELTREIDLKGCTLIDYFTHGSRLARTNSSNPNRSQQVNQPFEMRPALL